MCDGDYVAPRRVRHDIIMEILKITKKGVHKTKIMYQARLSHSQLEKYLNALKKEGFIVEHSAVWKTTDKGLNVIAACELCHHLMKTVQ